MLGTGFVRMIFCNVYRGLTKSWSEEAKSKFESEQLESKADLDATSVNLRSNVVLNTLPFLHCPNGSDLIGSESSPEKRAVEIERELEQLAAKRLQTEQALQV